MYELHRDIAQTERPPVASWAIPSRCKRPARLSFFRRLFGV